MTSTTLLVFAFLASSAATVTLHGDEPAVAGPTSVLAGHEPLRRLVQAMESGHDTVLAIRHAGGEVDRSRALRVHAALVALGIPSARLRLEPAAAERGSLIIELQDSGHRTP